MTSSRSSDLGTPSLLMASIRAATFSMEARVSARRSCGERCFVSEAMGDGLAGASTSMGSAFGAAAIGSAGVGEDEARGRKWWGEEAAEVNRIFVGLCEILEVKLLIWAPNLQSEE